MKNSEFFSLSGAPIPTYIVEKAQEAARKKYVEYKRKDPHIEAILQKIDFTLLEDIVLDYAQKTGLSRAQINIVRSDRISHNALGLSEGTYHEDENLIGLNWHFIEKRYREMGLELGALKTLIHEETHAASKARCVGYFDPSVLDTKRSTGPYRKEKQSGYHRIVDEIDHTGSPGRSHYSLFEFFNEAVVEKLSLEIFEEYLKRDSTFATQEEVREFLSKIKKPDSLRAYKEEVLVLETLIIRLAEEAGVPEDVIWGGMIRGLFEGEKFDDSEFQQALADTFSPSFLDKLQTFAFTKQQEELLAELAKPEIVTKKGLGSLGAKIMGWIHRTV